MATRDLMPVFQKVRSESKNKSTTSVAISISPNAPLWLDRFETIRTCLYRAYITLTALEQAQTDSLKPTFNEELEQTNQQRVESLTREATGLIKQIKVDMKWIINCDVASFGTQEKTAHLNAQRYLASRLKLVSERFHQLQDKYGAQLKAQFNDELPKEFDDPTDDVKLIELKMQEAKMTSKDQAQQNICRQIKILEIAKSVQELAQMFQDLDSIIVQQGTVLDRIDYNIEHALLDVSKGTEHLAQAEKLKPSTRSLKCIAVLIVLIVVMAIMLILKYLSLTQ